MIIEYKNYLIKPASTGRFDLVRKAQRNKKDKKTGKSTGETYETEIIMAYDIGLEVCIKYIVLEELKEKENVVSLREFLAEYKQEKELLLQILKLD